MHDVIEKYNGQIINYIGDSVMVVFGAPKKLEDHEIVSVRCAMEMREKLEEMNQKWDETEFSRYWKNHGIEKITARDRHTYWKRYRWKYRKQSHAAV